ncbi:UNVERIFIED_CONTAM: hypothetical protein Sradi_6921700 [Sesamum radiatum]|uniref:Uncharacterized protein n=1 Tax=Sesamum radiatum TaxID=300843 RepID=A0AAW2JH85_SESRA
MCMYRSHGTFPLFGLQSIEPTDAPPWLPEGFAATAPSYSSGPGSYPMAGYRSRYHCGPPPEFPLASPPSGIVHHLSGSDKYVHLNLSKKIKVSRRCTPWGGSCPSASLCFRVDSPIDSHTCQTPWSSSRQVKWEARLLALGARRAMEFHGHIDCPGFGSCLNLCWSSPRADQWIGSRCSTSNQGSSSAPNCFPPDNFLHSVTLSSKFFSSFPRGICSLSVSCPYLALDEIYHPIEAALPNNPDLPAASWSDRVRARWGSHPFRRPILGDLGSVPLRVLLQTTIRTAKPPDSQVGLKKRIGPGSGGSANNQKMVKQAIINEINTRSRGVPLIFPRCSVY